MEQPAGAAHRALDKSIGLIDTAMLGAGAAIGVSIFSVLAPAARVAGSGMLVSALIAVAPMAVFAIVYAFMASILPKSGASYEWPREFIHPFVGFLVAWLRILGSVGVLTTLTFVFVQYMAMAIALPARPVMFLLLFAVFAVNVRGIRISAKAQTIAMSLLLFVLALFVAAGAPRLRLAAVGNPFAAGLLPVLSAVPLLIPLFLGIETATEVGEEVRDGRRVIPLALGLALALTLIVFLAVAFTGLGLLGPAALAASSAPLVDAGRRSLDGLALPVILFAAGLSILKSLNSLFVVFSRYLFAMARAGAFPAAMAKVHPRWGTPHIAAAVAFACATAGLLLPRDLVFLFVAISIPTVLKYLSTCACALSLVHTRPELAATARLKLSRLATTILASLGIGCALVIFAFGVNADWRAYALIAAWGTLGVIYWLIRGRANAAAISHPRHA